MPSQHATKVVDFFRLDGGLNLWELDYRLGNNQSPEVKNLWWQDGVLQCRDGQVSVHDDASLGTGYACFSADFWGYGFFHIGNALYAMKLLDVVQQCELVKLIEGVPENRGTFFCYNDFLFYKNRGGFYKVTYNPDGGVLFEASSVLDDAYTPITILNASPDTGSGDLYQPENRLSDKKTVKYNVVKTTPETTVYKLPVKDVDGVIRVVVDGEDLTPGTDYSVDTEVGAVTFVKAPPAHDPVVNNTVEITYSKANSEAMQSIMDCVYAAVYGGDGGICMVLGGSTQQPNAFFWNGNDEYGMNYAYWPMPFYQLAGDTEDGVTGFGVQYGTLIVLKHRSVGKSNFNIERLDGRDSVSMNYGEINNKIGCDLPWTIQLVENNVVFCNTSGGVYLIRDSSAAHENNVVCLSRNVNGNPARPGLLSDVQRSCADLVCSFDDDNRYWLCANGHVYVWDYLLSTWNNPSWFYFTDVHGISYLRSADKSYHLDSAGRVTRWARVFSDYNGAIEKVYQFPPQFFDTYERLKDILDCIFVVRSDTDTDIRIQYQTDYETREDLTTLESYSWRLFPRNLNYRHLAVQKFATSARRRPGCRHVRHFAMRLSNNQVAQDLAVVSAQIHFRYTGKDR